MNHIGYMEKRKHGTSAFPIQYYYVDRTHPRYVMTAHWHREFEIIRVLSGNFTVYLNNTEHILKQNDVLFVGCGCLHRGQPDECVYECIVVDLKMLLSQQDDVIERYISQIINCSVNIKNILSHEEQETLHTIDRLFTSMSSTSPYYELSVYGLLFTLISQLYSSGYISASGCTQPSRQVAQISSILDWINQNYKEQINLKKLSAVTNLNPNYICKIFKNFTGQTITQYANELRIEHACYDIAQNNKSITEAAFRNGFNDLSYFSKTFRLCKGMTPREWKQLAHK